MFLIPGLLAVISLNTTLSGLVASKSILFLDGGKSKAVLSLTDLTAAFNLSLCSVLPAALSVKGLSFCGIL